MVSPRRDCWTVQGWKPRDIALFDSLIPQPFQGFSRKLMDRGPSKLLYEMFGTEEEARRYADLARAAGATQVQILPPVLPGPRVKGDRPPFPRKGGSG